MPFYQIKDVTFVRSSPKGGSIYDVRTEGGGGVSPKEDVVREVA